MKTIINGRFAVQNLSGIQRFSYEISRRLPAINYCPHEPKLEYFGLNHRVLRGFSKMIFWEQLTLFHYAKKKGYQVFHPLGTGFIFHGVPQVITIHDVGPLIYPQWWNKSYSKWYRFAWRRSVKISKAIVTVSEFSKYEIMRTLGVSGDIVHVVPNGLSSDFLDRPRLVSQSIVSSNSDYILFVGVNSPRKNLERLYSAFHLVSEHYPELKLIIAGAIDIDCFTQKTEAISSNITKLGPVSNEMLIELYDNARALVFPSLYEGFGIPIIEAASRKCPVVVSNGNHVPDLLSGNAVYCDPLDVKSISAAIKKALELGKDCDSVNLSYEESLLYDWDRSVEGLSRILYG